MYSYSHCFFILILTAFPLQSNPEFEKAVEECGWYEHIKTIFQAAYRVRDLLDVDSTTVIVHCSDGWDRTAQTVPPPLLCPLPRPCTLRDPKRPD